MTLFSAALLYLGGVTAHEFGHIFIPLVYGRLSWFTYTLDWHGIGGLAYPNYVGIERLWWTSSLFSFIFGVTYFLVVTFILFKYKQPALAFFSLFGAIFFSTYAIVENDLVTATIGTIRAFGQAEFTLTALTYLALRIKHKA